MVFTLARSLTAVWARAVDPTMAMRYNPTITVRCMLPLLPSQEMSLGSYRNRQIVPRTLGVAPFGITGVGAIGRTYQGASGRKGVVSGSAFGTCVHTKELCGGFGTGEPESVIEDAGQAGECIPGFIAGPV